MFFVFRYADACSHTARSVKLVHQSEPSKRRPCTRAVYTRRLSSLKEFKLPGLLIKNHRTDPPCGLCFQTGISQLFLRLRDREYAKLVALGEFAAFPRHVHFAWSLVSVVCCVIVQNKLNTLEKTFS